LTPNCPKCREAPHTLEHWLHCRGMHSAMHGSEVFGSTESLPFINSLNVSEQIGSTGETDKVNFRVPTPSHPIPSASSSSMPPFCVVHLDLDLDSSHIDDALGHIYIRRRHRCPFSVAGSSAKSFHLIFMVALWNRADHYIFILSFVLLLLLFLSWLWYRIFTHICVLGLYIHFIHSDVP